ncbi:MAG: ROK family protein [Velocimicrobium sp.]
MYHIKQGINQETIQEINRALLLKHLRKEGVCSRVHLSNLTGLKQATVTNIMKDFIEWGLVKEVGFLSGNKGRRSIGIEVESDLFRVIGVRLARKHYSIGLFDLNGKCVKEVRVEINSLESNQPICIINGMIETILKVINENSENKILAIGVAVPGPFIRKKNRIGLITETQGWNGIDIQKRLQSAISLPMYLEHDANVGAFAYMWDLKENYKDETLVYFAAGQGVGAGIVMDGEIYQGAIGTAGEIGHMTIDYEGPKCACGNYGCLEKYTSSIEYTKAVNSIIKKQYTFKEVIELYRQGNEVCREQYRKACRMMGYGIINLINLYNPNIIIIGDEMMKVDADVMYENICNTVKERVLPEIWNDVSIRKSEYNGDAMLHGAAMVAISEIFNHPEQFTTK